MPNALPAYGDILYVRTTEEPALVLKAFKYFTLVRRPVMGQQGIRHKLTFFLNAELESLQDQTARTLTNIQQRQAIVGASEFGPEDLMPSVPFKKNN